MHFVAIASLILSAVFQTKPVPAPELALFEPLLGEWSGDVTLGTGPGQQLKGKTTFRFERILDGLYVQVTLAQDLPGMGVVRGQTTYAWDVKEKKLRSFTFTNGGMSDPSKPRAETGTLTLGSIDMASMDSQPAYRQRFEVQQDGSMKYRLQMAMGPEGKLMDIGQGTLRKKS